MTKLKLWLSGLLAIQVALAMGFYFASQNRADFDDQKKLLSILLSDIDKIEITDKESSAVMEKISDRWVLPEYQQLPINEKKLSEVVLKLENLKSGWPVATSASSHRRFEVAEEIFERRLQFYQEGTLAAEIFLGTSPGYRSVHARSGDDGEVFSVKLASHEFPANDKDWLDKSLLNLSTIERIKGVDFELQKVDDKWTFVQASVVEEDVPPLDTKKADELTSLFTNIRVQDAALNIPLENTIDIVVNDADRAWTYQFLTHKDAYYVLRDDREIIFEISEQDYEKVAEANLSNLALDASLEEKEQDPVDLSLN